MKKIANKKAFQDLLLIIIGSGLTALPVKCIYDPLDMVTGGFSGLAIINAKVEAAGSSPVSRSFYFIAETLSFS